MSISISLDHFKNYEKLFKQEQERTVLKKFEEYTKLVQLKRYDQIDWLLQDHKYMITAVDADQNTLLHRAVMEGDLSLVTYFTKYTPQLNINAKNKFGETALHIAIKYNAIEDLLIRLILGGADPNTTMYPNELQHPQNFTLLFSACVKKQYALMGILVEKGADVAPEKTEGLIALNSAIESKNMSLTQLLIDKTDDVNVADDFGRTPVYSASLLYGYDSKKTIKILDALLKKGANPNTALFKSYNLLHWALDYHDIDLVKLILRSGADVNAKDKDGNTALHLAIQSTQAEIANLLINWDGIDFRIKNNAGKRAKDLAIDDAQKAIAAFIPETIDIVVEEVAQASETPPLPQVLVELNIEENHQDMAFVPTLILPATPRSTKSIERENKENLISPAKRVLDLGISLLPNGEIASPKRKALEQITSPKSATKIKVGEYMFNQDKLLGYVQHPAQEPLKHCEQAPVLLEEFNAPVLVGDINIE